MHDDEVRELLRAEAGRAPRPQGLRRNSVRTARLRRVALVSTSIVTLLAVAVSASLAVRALSDRREELVAPGPRPAGRIAFARWTEAGSGIQVMQADGSDVRLVADGGHHAVDRPAWSPDGSEIAFRGYYGEARDEDGGLFVTHADGSKRRLVETGSDAPVWSPDGRWLAYEKQGDIRVVRSGGGEPITVNGTQQASAPTWDASSGRLAWHGCCEDGDEIYVADVPPRRVDRLTDEPDDGASGAYTPAWSPDGRWILHGRIRYDEATLTDSEALYVMAPDGSGVRRVTPDMHVDGAPVWSPDGARFAVAARLDTDETSRVYVGDLSGEGAFLTEGRAPAWAPDGSRIAFTRAEDASTSHVYSIGADGSDLQQLTFGDVADHSPDWTAMPPPDCGRTDVASDEYGVELGSTTGRAGARIAVSGTTFRTEDGRWAPADRIEMWWNSETPTDARPIGEGPAFELLQVDAMDGCTWEGSFTVPDVPPGEYRITAFVFDEKGYGVFGTDAFTVEDADGEDDSNYAWPDPLLPPTEPDGDRTVLPVLFMNRTAAHLSYPTELGLAEMGVQTTISYTFEDGRERAGAPFDVVAVHGEVPDGLLGEELDRFDSAPFGEASLHEVVGRGRLRGLRQDPPYALVYRTPGWNLVATLPSREEAKTVADHLHPSVTEEGWPSLLTSGPLELSEGFGEARGPHIEFNDEDPRFDVHTDGTYVVMGVVDGCGRADEGVSGSGPDRYAAKCLAFEDGYLGIFVSIYGPEQFVRDLYEGLRLEE